MAQLYVGIDLGTTNSTVSVIQTEDRRLRNPIDHLRSIPILQYDKDFNLTRDKYTLPSYFYYKNDGVTKRVYTGEWAKNIYATGNQPMNTFTGIKTRMGGESMIAIPGCDVKSLNLTVWRTIRPNQPFRWLKPSPLALSVMALFKSL